MSDWGWVTAHSAKLFLSLWTGAIRDNILRGWRVKHNIILRRRNGEGRGIWNCDWALIRYLHLLRMNLVLFDQHRLANATWMAWMSWWDTKFASCPWWILNLLLVIMAGKEWSMKLPSLMMNFMWLNSDIWITWIAPVLLYSKMKLLGATLKTALGSCLLSDHIAFAGLPAWMLLRIIWMTLLSQLETTWCSGALIGLLSMTLMTLLLILILRRTVRFLHIMVLK